MYVYIYLTQNLSVVKRILTYLNVTLNLKRILVDFEVAIHSAIANVWPEIEIKGCRFHLGQSWWRKIQEIGLSAEYKDRSSEVGKFLKYFLVCNFSTQMNRKCICV